MPHRRPIFIAVFAACLAIIAVAIAQQQADNRALNPALNPTGGVRNFRPNDFSVGNSVYYNTPRQFGILPSEARMAAQRSGALPSELRMNAQRVGPLNPYGAIAYIPQQSTIQQLMRLPPPQLYNPAYRLTPALRAPAAGGATGSIAYTMSPTVRSPLYSSPQRLPNALTPPEPTRIYSTAPRLRPSEPTTGNETTQPAAPQEPSPSELNYGSIFFSSINPPPKH